MASLGELMAAGTNDVLAGMLGQEKPSTMPAPAGTNVTTATALGNQSFIILTTVPSGTGFMLPAAVGTAVVSIYNGGSNALKVYGNLTSQDAINGSTYSTGVSVTNGKSATFNPCKNAWVFNLSA